MSASAELSLHTRPIERLPADVAVAGFFADDRPLRGGAGRLDWRLCGRVSDLLLAGRMAGERGEAVLVPAMGVIAAQRVLVLGLGARADFSVVAAQHAMREACERCLVLGLRDLAIAPLGIAADDFPRHAQAIVGGLAESLANDAPLRVRMPVRATDAERAFQALETALQVSGESGIRLQPGTPVPGPAPALRGTGAGPPRV